MSELKHLYPSNPFDTLLVSIRLAKFSNYRLQSGMAQSKTKTSSGRKQKNPAAVALGRLGGLKGGKARARKLSAQRRSEIARMGANSRNRVR